MTLSTKSGTRFGTGRKLLICASALALVVLGAASSDAQVPAPKQSVPIAITGATVHTVTNGVINNGTILFENGRIVALGANVTIPANAERVDATGKHIYPGLVDAYSQMGLFEIGGFDVTIDLNELGDFNPNVRTHVAFNPESRHIGVARSNGVVVTVTAPGGGLISGLSSAMQLDGWTWEEMTLKPEVGLIVNWPSSGNQASYDEGVSTLRGHFAEAKAYRKARQAAPGSHESDSRYEAMIPVLEGKVPVVVNADDIKHIQDAVAWAEAEEVRLVILGGREAVFVADLLARKKIPVILTSVIDSPDRAWEGYDASYTIPMRLHKAGVLFAIAGESSAPYTNRLPYEAGAAISYGLPEEVALKAVTLMPAQFMGIADRVGSLEVGKDATLLITTGSPLEYSTLVEQVYIEGREIDMKDMHRAFYEKYMEKLRQVMKIVM